MEAKLYYQQPQIKLSNTHEPSKNKRKPGKNILSVLIVMPLIQQTKKQAVLNTFFHEGNHLLYRQSQPLAGFFFLFLESAFFRFFFILFLVSFDWLL